MAEPKKKMPDGKDNGGGPPRKGSVIPEDQELATWLHRFWARGEFPERVELWQVFGRNGMERGHQIEFKSFRANAELNAEQATVLANELIAAAQHDTNTRNRATLYEICVVDPHRKAVPIVRRLGPIQPTHTYLTKSGAGSSSSTEDDDDDSPLTAKGLSLHYARDAFDQVRWDKQRYDTVMGQMLTLQSNIIDKQQAALERATDKVMSIISSWQDAEDRRADRDIRRKKEELKADILRDIFRGFRNLVPGLVASARDDQKAGALPNGATQGALPTNDHGPSPERALVDNILTDCEDAKIDVELFGEAHEEDGKPVPHLSKPGIFNLKQLGILLGVRNGQFSPTALDLLLPDSGKETAVTNEQLTKALGIMPEHIMLAFRELFMIRQNARVAAANKPDTETESK